MTDVEGRRARTATASVLLAFVLQSAYFTGFFPPFWNPNELSRFQAVVAMGEWRTLSIDRAVQMLGDHEDKSASGGRFYSNKAPGLAFAALPAYALLRLAFPEPTPASAAPLFWALRLLTVTVVCAFALGRLAVRLERDTGNPAAAPLTVLAVALGTPYLFYARSFFAHAWTAALLFLAWDRLRASEAPASEGGSRRPAIAALLAGVLAGWAVISEYTVAPIALVFALRALARPNAARLSAFALGAGLPLVLLLAYNAACFGSPFTLSSAREADPAYAELASRGVFGLGAPSVSVAREFLVGPSRGLFLFSPFLLWFFWGAWRWWRTGKDRADCLFVLAATAVFFVAMAGYPNWHGGWSLGSRYLLPGLLLVALAVGRGLETPLSRGIFFAATVAAVGSHALLTATFAHLSPDQAWPAATTSAWFLARGWIAQSLASIAGAGGVASLVLPVLLTLLAVSLVARAARPMRPALPIAALLGLAPLLVLLARPPGLSFHGRLWRAAVFGAFSGRDPERLELREAALGASTEAERRRAFAMWRVYGPPGAPPLP
jgi:hypothetical protein